MAQESAPVIKVTVVVMTIYSLVVAVSAHVLGIGWSGKSGVPGYFQKLNWALFPVWWTVLGVLVHLSWQFYMSGWRSLPSEGVLHCHEAPASRHDAFDSLLSRFREWRRYLAIVAIPLGLLVSAVDGVDLLQEFGWITLDCRPRSHCSTDDFTVAFRLPEAFGAQTKTVIGWFVLAQYTMQGLLISLAFLVLFQLILHSVVFLRFERLRPIRSAGMSIRLNPCDPAQQFGLSVVNHAINITYVFIAIGMVIPLISFINKPRADTGTLLMTWLLPLVLALPAAIPLVERYSRQREAEARVKAESFDGLWISFHKQHLWPMIGTPFSWIGLSCLMFSGLIWARIAGPEIWDFVKKFL